MRLRVTVERGSLEWLKALGASIPRALAKGTDAILAQASREVELRVKPGMDLTPRSGGLGKSWVIRRGAELVIRETSTGASGSLGSNHPAAKIHNDGGTIVPKSARWLAVPLKAAKTASGVAKVASPNEVEGLFVVRGKKSGKLILVRKKDNAKRVFTTVGDDSRVATGRRRYKAATLEPWFVLLDKVVLPARHYVDNAAAETDKKAGPIMDAAVQAYINKAVAA